MSIQTLRKYYIMCTPVIVSYTYKIPVDASHDIFFKNLLAEYTQQLNKMWNKIVDETKELQQKNLVDRHAT
jgi:ABC-type oligopeptide transport system ATPase subunit